MTGLEKIEQFFLLAKELNYDIVKIHEQDPTGVYVFVGVIIATIFVLAWFRNTAKKAAALDYINDLEDTTSFEDFENKLDIVVKHLPKGGEDFISAFKSKKDVFLKKELGFLAPLSIEEKIEKYQNMSASYKKISTIVGSDNLELLNFYKKKSEEILSKNLIDDIANYSKVCEFKVEDIPALNAVVAYANKQSKPDEILEQFITKVNTFDYSNDLEFFRFIKELEKDKALQLYENCTQKLDQALEQDDAKVSKDILDYLMDNDKKDEVYSYIKNLKDKEYLQELYNSYFNQKDDVNLDLSFIANSIKIDSDYENYLDTLITENWRDIKFLEFLNSSGGVLQIIGHDKSRGIIERIDSLEKDERNEQMLKEALKTAKEAEYIALEAKSIATGKNFSKPLLDDTKEVKEEVATTEPKVESQEEKSSKDDDSYLFKDKSTQN